MLVDHVETVPTHVVYSPLSRMEISVSVVISMFKVKTKMIHYILEPGQQEGCAVGLLSDSGDEKSLVESEHQSNYASRFDIRTYILW